MNRKTKKIINISQKKVKDKQKKKTVRAKSILLGKNTRIDLELSCTDKDYQKAHRAVLTTLIHGLDSKICKDFRINFEEEFKYMMSSVHDRFGGIPPYLYEEAVLMYKQLMYKHIFSLKLTDIFLIQDDDPQEFVDKLKFLMDKIQESKNKNDFKEALLKEFSFALYPE